MILGPVFCMAVFIGNNTRIPNFECFIRIVVCFHYFVG